MVTLAPLSIGTLDLMDISSFTGVPVPLVRQFAARLLANGVWRPNGKVAVCDNDPETGEPVLDEFDVILDTLIAVGYVESRAAPAVEDAGTNPGTPKPTARRRPPMPADSIPDLIRAAGEPAVCAYREFLGDTKRTLNTRKLYGNRARRFFRWAEGRSLTLDMIDAPVLAAYAAEVAAAKSQHEATIYLTPVRGLFRHLVAAGALAVNPCEASRPGGRETGSEPTGERSQHLAGKFGPTGFPLLDLLAMLGHMEEQTLRQVFDDEAIALFLLERVRWPDGAECPHCGAGAGDHPTAQVVCAACAKTYAVTTGTMFEDSPVQLRHWLFLMHQKYLAADTLSDNALERCWAWIRRPCRPSALASRKRWHKRGCERERT